MATVLVFQYDCGFEVGIPASPVERAEFLDLLGDVADQRHDQECQFCSNDHPIQSTPTRDPTSQDTS
jgi:hypothetical protein